MDHPVHRHVQHADGKPASTPVADGVEQDKQDKQQQQQLQRDLKRGLPASPPASIVPADEQRATKRARRDRGSTAKDRISKIPPCVSGKRSSIYRGVTRHRWTGRYEAHLWDKSTWNQSQNKKGKQVYLGAYDEEEAAARAYDLAALKYWGPGTTINFPVTDYTRDVDEMQSVSREEYLASLRRKSSGFSRGVSKYRGVARHHHNGRWEARIGRVFGNKYLYLGTYSTQEEAAAAYDMAAIQHRGLNAVTNFDLSHYIKWLRPRQPGPGSSGSGAGWEDGDETAHKQSTAAASVASAVSAEQQQESQAHGGPEEEQPSRMWPGQASEPYQFPSLGMSNVGARARAGTQRAAAPQAPTALGLLWQSTMFKEMRQKADVNPHSPADGQPEAEQEQEEQDELDVEGDADGLSVPELPGLEEEPPPALGYEEGQGEVAYQDLSFFSEGHELESSLPVYLYTIPEVRLRCNSL